ncbi:MAG: methyltransferase domain-containing protein [Pseudomonadota bacterium]
MRDRAVTRSYRARFHAWWEGVDLPPPPDSAAEPLLLDREAAPEPVARGNGVAKAWPQPRIEAAQRIWGRDFIAPGGADFTLELAKPFGAGPRTSLCDLQAGLGGGTRAIAKAYGVWVTGLEPDPDLADLAHRRSRALAVERKAPIEAYDPETLTLKPESFDCLFGREGFCHVIDKAHLLNGLVAALRAHGQLIFTDLVLADTAAVRAAADGAVGRWAAAEPRPPHPWPADRMVEALAERGLDVRIRQDITPLYRGLVVGGFKRLADQIRAGAVGRDQLAPVLAETERWARRVTALDRGALRCYRFHAIKQAA